MTDTEPLISDAVKKERSSAQLEALSKARVKAAEVRAKNTELRKKEREVVSAQLAENRRLREENIEREHAAKFSKPEEPASSEAPPKHEEEEEIVYERKPKKKRRVVVVQQSSDSEEEIEVKLPKQKNKRPQASEVDALYQRTYQRMFEL